MSDPVTRLNAALEGRYVLERELGQGGMATVYLARDLKHERSVALKVLKPELAAVVGAERFLAEIKTTANLQHPHILPLFDSGEADTFLFYVMPYVQGETLRDRLDRDRQLPVEEAVGIASAVATALEHAHDQGVIHRDIKPANILLQSGQPVVADFGIALAVGAGGSQRLTETGLSVGTPYYMSPEQATGDQNVGPTTDIYALGCVLYEMLVGEPPYSGSSAQAVLGKIIAGDPVSAREHRASVPLHVDAAIRCALEKTQADRFRTASDFGAALKNRAFRYGEMAQSPLTGSVHRAWRAAALALVVFILLLGSALIRELRRSNPEGAPLSLTLELPEDQSLVMPGSILQRSLSLSDDGAVLVYSGPSEGGNYQLWVRDRGSVSPRPLPNTRIAAGFDDRDIQAVRLDGEAAPITLAGEPNVNERAPSLSQNDEWVAYVSDKTSRDEIWVSPFPNPDGLRQQVTTQGGREPLWASSGDALFFRNLSGEMVRMEVTTAPGFTSGAQTTLFSVSGFLDDPNHRIYDITPDDLRFLMLREEAEEGQVVWVENWTTELKRVLGN